MNQYTPFSILKDNAKGHLTGKYSSAIFTNMIPGFVTLAITLCITMFLTTISTFSLLMSNPGILENPVGLENPALLTQSVGATIATYLFSQITSIFTGVFNTGIALYFLNLACGRIATVSDIFYGFKHLFKKSLTISAVNVLFSTICLMPYNVFYALYLADGGTKWLIYTAVSLGLGALVYLPIALSLSQCYFLLLDFPSYSAKEIIFLSVRIMKGRKVRLFLLELSFIPLTILSMLTLGIGDLWLTPYMNMTMALFFLDIMKHPNN